MSDGPLTGWSSYRVVLHIGELRPGRHPREVLVTAADAVACRYPVEDCRIDLLRGVPVVTVRFALPAPATGSEGRTLAWGVVDGCSATVNEVAEVVDAHLARRSARGRWLMVRRDCAHHRCPGEDGTARC